ncbi:hypothetical protein VP1G_11417 [Cytospora mali]|uniref:CFEM domain-containing protein n=1 Tax=Cytospora mali TaxID=578113 RepID=A0A194VFW6_CYTMA|nr:hypothetical protein VP1G_11417 [Valsa mali var. pyri (nom. inval.)]
MQPINYILSITVLTVGVAQAMPSDMTAAQLLKTPSCLRDCIRDTEPISHCGGLNNFKCLCDSGPFIRDVYSCISRDCPDLLKMADGIKQKYCH